MGVLDTDHRSLLERINSPEGQRLNVRPEAQENEDPVTTIISYEEHVRGRMAVIANANSMAKQIEAFGKLHQQLKNYCSLKVLDFSDRAAIEFQRLRKEYRRLATMDLKIAAIAISQNAVLLSRNLRDFQQINGLQVEDWTREASS